MSTLAESTRVLLISRDPQIIQQVEETLAAEKDFTLIKDTNLGGGALAAVTTVQPEVILLDKLFDPDRALSTIDEIVAAHPAIPVVVILPDVEVQQSNSVILAGARAFLLFPFTQGSLVTTLRRVKELLQRTTAAQQPSTSVPAPVGPSRNTIVVYSPKGGVGCTSIAVNLAIALRQELNEEVLLIDGKHLLGHVALMLNLRTANSIADLIPHAGKLDSGLIRQVAVSHVSGIQVLPSPVQITRAQGIRPDDLYKVILGLQNVFPNIVIDGGNYLNDNLVTYMDAADKIILVVTPNLAALRDARQFLDISHTLSYSKDKILLVLNQAGHRSDVKLSEIENVLRAQVFATIPADEDIMLSSLNEGLPVLLKKSNHAISKAIKKMAGSVAQIFKQSAAIRGEDGKKSSIENLKKSSRLG